MTNRQAITHVYALMEKQQLQLWF